MGVLFDELKNHQLYIDDDRDTTISNIRSKARRQQMEHGLDLLVIDYLQLIEVTDRASGENRTQQVSHISRSLKNLARELGISIIALSQLSRLTEQRNPPIPILSDLRDSGTIEQDADIVLMLYREDMHNEDCDNPGETDVFVRKNRNGPTGRVSLFFDAGKMSFRDIGRGGTSVCQSRDSSTKCRCGSSGQSARLASFQELTHAHSARPIAWCAARPGRRRYRDRVRAISRRVREM